jgi:hypothetical protein
MENDREKLERVKLMAAEDSAWDLSPNDIAALRYVLKHFRDPMEDAKPSEVSNG